MGYNLSIKNVETLKQKLRNEIVILENKLLEINKFEQIVNDYIINNEKQKIIKYYALYGNLRAVCLRMILEEVSEGNINWNPKKISMIIKNEPVEDELHYILKKNYGKDFLNKRIQKKPIM